MLRDCLFLFWEHRLEPFDSVDGACNINWDGKNQFYPSRSRILSRHGVFTFTLHNIPEGMAVGVLYAGWLSGNAQITEAAALTLALGIAIQNFPEGAIISMPLHSNGLSKTKSCILGILSGIVEPIAGFITVLLSSLIISALPYYLSFAAGAMFYVVIEELIPEMSEGKHSNIGTLMFMVGFSLMMMLDVALG